MAAVPGRGYRHLMLLIMACGLLGVLTSAAVWCVCVVAVDTYRYAAARLTRSSTHGPVEAPGSAPVAGPPAPCGPAQPVPSQPMPTQLVPSPRVPTQSPARTGSLRPVG